MATQIPADPIDDQGSDSQERFRYQAACMLYFAFDILDANSAVRYVYAERFEDALVEYEDGRLTPISIKSREAAGKIYTLFDEPVYKPLARFAVHEKFHGARIKSYVWAIANHAVNKPVADLFEQGLDGLAVTTRDKLIRTLIDTAKTSFQHDIEQDHIEAAIEKLEKKHVALLEEYEMSLVGQVNKYISRLAALPSASVHQRVRAAIDKALGLACAECDLVLPQLGELTPQQLDATRALAKRLDAERLHEFLGAVGTCIHTPADRMLERLADLPPGELERACVAFALDPDPMQLAERIIAVEPHRQIQALLELKSQFERVLPLTRMIRRLSTTAGKTELFRTWREHRVPPCIAISSLGHPWFVEDLIETVNEELTNRWVLVSLNQNQHLMTDQQRFDDALLEICAAVGLDDVDLSELEDVIDEYQLRVVLSVSGRDDPSRVVAHLTEALPKCLIVVELDPEGPEVDTCAALPTPSMSDLSAYAKGLTTLAAIHQR